jgi:hypothetical protein
MNNAPQDPIAVPSDHPLSPEEDTIGEPDDADDDVDDLLPADLWY